MANCVQKVERNEKLRNLDLVTDFLDFFSAFVIPPQFNLQTKLKTSHFVTIDALSGMLCRQTEMNV